jgi:hypothetical protein
MTISPFELSRVKATASGIWASAIDVDTPTGVGVSYRISTNRSPNAL